MADRIVATKVPISCCSCYLWKLTSRTKKLGTGFCPHKKSYTDYSTVCPNYILDGTIKKINGVADEASPVC